jgi:hypothetical protein
MRRFQLISDIHLEFGMIYKIKKLANYLILAGDIGYPDQKIFKDFLSSVSLTFDKVFYITGNHEYYQNWKKEANIKLDTINETNEKIRQIIKESGNNIYFLNNDFHDIDSNLRIVGSTLWTNINYNNKPINDSYQIYSDDKILASQEDFRNLHKHNVKFIESQILEAKTSNKKLVVVTHHLPTHELILPKYKTQFYSSYNTHFASDLDYLIQEPIKAWCAGHSHGFNHKIINNVNCYVNAYGYPSEDKNGASLDFTFGVEVDE